jgi:hypothetical protein
MRGLDAMRALRIAFLPLVAGCLLAACGGSDDDKSPPGSASNPLVAVPNPSATRTPPVKQPPGEGAARATARSGDSKGRAPSSSSSTRTQHGSVARRPSRSRSRSGETAGDTGARGTTARKQLPLAAGASRPCSLVTKSQAAAIVGAPLVEPLEAPQGPTCIYQTKSGKPYITLAVQSVSFAKLRKQIHKTRAVAIADRTAYCGTYGEPMLFLPVAGGRVLTISAPCNVAQQFAAKAVGHL